MTVSRESMLYAALMGSSDCPLARLMNVQSRLHVEGNRAAAAYVDQLIKGYTAAESRLIAVADQMPFDVKAAEEAVNTHRFVITSVLRTIDLHAAVPA